MINKPHLSIIIVNWNGMPWLDRLIQSLQTQTFDDYEIIVVDNASTDDSVEFLKAYYPYVRLIQNTTNRGFAYANNLGINNSMGGLILLLNNDTWVESDFLDKLIGYYESNKLDVISAFEANYFTKEPHLQITTIDPLGYPLRLDLKNTKLMPFYLNGSCLLFSKKLYIDTGGLDDNFFMYFEETDWFWRLNLLGKKFAYTDSTYIYHAGVIPPTKTLRINQFLWRNQNNLQMLIKNYSISTLALVLPIYLTINIIEMLCFLVINRKICYTYLSGWWFNIKNIKIILKKRQQVQSSRKYSDTYIVNKMYKGSAKLTHLLIVLQAIYKRSMNNDQLL